MTPKALAPGSYHAPDRKTPGGQFPAPEPDGTGLARQRHLPRMADRRAPVARRSARSRRPAPEEVGRGPLSEQMGRFKAVRLVRGGVVLEYTAGGADVREWMTLSEHDGQLAIERHFHVGPVDRAAVARARIQGQGHDDVAGSCD